MLREEELSQWCHNCGGKINMPQKITLDEIKKAQSIAERQIESILTNLSNYTGLAVIKVIPDFSRPDLQRFLCWDYPYHVDIVWEKL